MLSPDDRDAIHGLFDRIETVAANGGPRDADAETLIQQRLRSAPASPYYMAQTILVQDQALRLAEQKIAGLEAEAARRPAAGGFLGGLFGDSQPQNSRQPVQRGPWDRDNGADNHQRGGGFLAGAAQTALGVTTGVLLGSAIAGLLAGDANAAEYNPDQPADQDQPADDMDTGGDDFGDSDIGGDF